MKKKLQPVIGIIGGTGGMGNWFRLFFEKNGLTVLVSGRKTALTSKEMVSKADIVIVSVPLKETVRVIREVRVRLKKNALLCDFASLKVESVKEMRKSKSGALGMHPLFGPAVHNLRNQTIVFCSKQKSVWIEFLRKLFEKNGAHIIEMTTEEHDKHSAVIQALLHFQLISYARALEHAGLKFLGHFSTPLFRLEQNVLKRMFSQEGSLFASIEMENPHFQKTLKKYQEEIEHLSKVVKAKDYGAFGKKFSKSKRFLDSLSKKRNRK